MNGNGDKEHGASEGDEYSLPIGEIATADSTVSPADPPVPTAAQQDISADLERTGAKHTVENQQEPLQVVILKDNELSTFESKTVRFGKWGTAIAALALLAASAAAYFVFQQFKEMASQTEILNRGARQARADSAASSIATAKQLSILQRQLMQTEKAFKIDEQARIKVTPQGIGWNSHDPQQMPFTSNWLYTNIGKTPGEVIGVDKHVALIPFTDNIDDIKFAHTVPVPVHTKKILMPGEDNFTTAIDQSFPSSMDAAVQRKEKLIASWGCIEYKDIFGGIHWADFCAIRLPAPNNDVYGSCAYQCQRKPHKPN